jgi:hypothetical protein
MLYHKENIVMKRYLSMLLVTSVFVLISAGTVLAQNTLHVVCGPPDEAASSDIPLTMELDTMSFTEPSGLPMASDGQAYDLVGDAASVSAVPEPSTFILVGVGLLGVGTLVRRKKHS